MATTHDIASKEVVEPKDPSPRIRTLPSVFSEVPGLPGSSGLARGSGCSISVTKITWCQGTPVRCRQPGTGSSKDSRDQQGRPLSLSTRVLH